MAVSEPALRGRTAIVTGAGKGIGRAVALALVHAGADVAAVARTQADLETLVADAAEGPGRCLVVPGDVTREADVLAAFDVAAERFGTPAILVNAAGAAVFGPTTECSLSEWRRILDANLTGTFLCCREALRRMGESGHIVNIGSVAGHVAFANSAAYCAAKWGVVGLTKSLAAEVRAAGQPGIHISLVSPGSTDTPLWEGQGWSPPKEDMLRPGDVAAMVLHIISQPENVTTDEVRLMPAKGIL